jgi:hypothetical protein
MRIFALVVIGRTSRNKGTTGYEPKRLYVGSTRNTNPCGLFAVTIFKCFIALIMLRDIYSLQYPTLTSKTIDGRRVSLFTSFVSSKHSFVPMKSERYSILNECLDSALTSCLFSDRHCFVYDQNLSQQQCLFLRRFYDHWYIVPIDFRSYPANLYNLQKFCKGLMNYLLRLLWGSMNVNHNCTLFFSLGSLELVQNLRFVTTASNPNLLNSEDSKRSKLFSLIKSPCSQFNSLVKNHPFKFTSFL